MANAISGTGTVNHIGTGIFTLSGANTYTGATTVQAGALQLGAPALWAVPVPILPRSRSTLGRSTPGSASVRTAPAQLNLNGTGLGGNGALTNGSSAISANYSGPGHHRVRAASAAPPGTSP